MNNKKKNAAVELQDRGLKVTINTVIYLKSE
jgi:hypothetical protein